MSKEAVGHLLAIRSSLLEERRKSAATAFTNYSSRKDAGLLLSVVPKIIALQEQIGKIDQAIQDERINDPAAKQS